LCCYGRCVVVLFERRRLCLGIFTFPILVLVFVRQLRDRYPS
jgi:hypothetical protein